MAKTDGRITAIVPAGGLGARMNLDTPRPTNRSPKGAPASQQGRDKNWPLGHSAQGTIGGFSAEGACPSGRRGSPPCRQAGASGGSPGGLHLAKPLIEIKKKPIFIYTLEALEFHPDIDEIILVFNSDGLEKARKLVKDYSFKKVSRVICGGKTRKESVRNGLEVLSSQTSLVVIHDGVRPFVDEGSISRVIEQAKMTGAAVLGVPVKSTIKRVDANNEVDATLKRDQLWEIQTPQVFERELIQKAYLRASKYCVPDDAALVELMGKKIKIVMGSYFNIKITTQEDLVFAEAIAAIRAIE